MGGLNFNPLKTGQSRVFVIEGRARPDHEPSYQACARAGSLDQSFGDIERIECPDPDRYGEFVEVGQVQGAKERPTISIEGRYARDIASELLRLGRKRCENDIQVHMGACTDPSDFDTFEKALIIEGAVITNYSTEDIGALASDENASVGESAEISAKDAYEVLQLSFQRRADDVITNEVLDGVVCDEISCGDCTDESSGCEKVYFITKAAGGSAGTPADIVFSLDKGVTWYAHDIDSLGVAEDPSGVACLGTYVVVVSNASDSLHYATKSDITAINDEVWTEVTTGFVAAGSPNDIWSTGRIAYVVGDAGYVYFTTDPTAGVTVADAGVATSLNLRKVHALSDTFAVAVGDSGAIVKTENRTTWTVVTPTNVLFTQNWDCVWVKSETEWWIGGATVGGVGQLWYTLDGGTTWTQATLPGTYTNVDDIQFASDSVVYVAATVSGPNGRLLRSYNGGNTFTILPEGTATLPANDRINAIATCADDVNFVVGGGLDDAGTDGYIVVGQD